MPLDQSMYTKQASKDSAAASTSQAKPSETTNAGDSPEVGVSKNVATAKTSSTRSKTSEKASDATAAKTSAPATHEVESTKAETAKDADLLPNAWIGPNVGYSSAQSSQSTDFSMKDQVQAQVGTVLDYVNVYLEEGAIAPDRAHPDDAGMDLFSRDNLVIPAGGSRVFDTGVHIELPVFRWGHNGIFCMRTAGFLRSKSGLYVKHGISSDGTIDVGYTGSIKVKLINQSKYDYQVNKGDKISQLVIVPVICPGVRIVHRLQPTVRGNNGFGST